MFCNGEVVYRPDPNNDEGMIRLRISDLAHPLEGTFDLSTCGDTGKYLSISTGYRKEKIAENANKVEIWFACRKFIGQELKEGRAQQFAGIFSKWKPGAPVGIFWTWGNDDSLGWFDYLTNCSNLTLTSKNLYENWFAGVMGGRAGTEGWLVGFAPTKNFMFILNNQN
jgi:hypothetical protein